MTTFTIKCETLARLASVCAYFDKDIKNEIKKQINTIRFENKNGRSYAISSNSIIASIEYLGSTEQPDGDTHLKLDKELLKAVKKGSLNNETATILTVPEIAVSTIQLSSGFTMSDCCYWLNETPLSKWRGWISREKLKKSSGAMFWDTYHIQTLLNASPSGKVVFPEFINCRYPVLIRDVNDKNWAGVFLPIPKIRTKETEPATIPEWWN